MKSIKYFVVCLGLVALFGSASSIAQEARKPKCFGDLVALMSQLAFCNGNGACGYQRAYFACQSLEERRFDFCLYQCKHGPFGPPDQVCMATCTAGTPLSTARPSYCEACAQR